MGELKLNYDSPISKQPSKETCQWMMNFFARTSIPRMDQLKRDEILKINRRHKNARINR